MILPPPLERPSCSTFPPPRMSPTDVSFVQRDNVPHLQLTTIGNRFSKKKITEVCSVSYHPSDAMSSVCEIEAVQNMDDLSTSFSTTRKPYPNFETLNARIATSWKMILTNARTSRKRSTCKSRKPKKVDRFLQGRQDRPHDLWTFSYCGHQWIWTGALWPSEHHSLRRRCSRIWFKMTRSSVIHEQSSQGWHTGKHVQHKTQRFGTVGDHMCVVQSRYGTAEWINKVHTLEEYGQKVLGSDNVGSKLRCPKRQDSEWSFHQKERGWKKQEQWRKNPRMQAMSGKRKVFQRSVMQFQNMT